jgi:hypothetical protein
MNATAEKIFAGRTAAEWRELAQDCRKRSAESWERSDTDGFLSQWASDQMASRYDDCAAVAEADGRVEVSAAFLLDGTVASVDYREGQYGWYYLINDAAEAVTGVRFFSPSGARKAATRAANNAKKGFTEGTVSVPAYLETSSGMVKPNYAAAREGDIKIVSVDSFQTQDN